MRICADNKIAKNIEIEGKKIVSSSIENLITGSRFKLSGYEFAVSFKVKERLFSKPILFTNDDMNIVKVDDNVIYFEGEIEGVNFKISLTYMVCADSGVIKKKLSLSASNTDIIIDYIDLDSFDTKHATFTWTIPMPKKRVYTPSYITTEGQPFYVNDLFFGAEFPVADNRIVDGITHAKYHIGRPLRDIMKGGSYETVTFVMGSGIGASLEKMRASFFKYVDSFARPARFRVQFNSWYDNMLDIDSKKIESSFTSIADGFKRAGYRPLDCYVVDDGWIDYKTPTFWEFDKNKFPQKFEKEKRLVSSFGSTFGVWFGPRGGYTTQTVKYAHLLKKIGYNVCKQSFDICTCDPKYIHDLCDRMASFCRDYGVTYFKIDGFAITPCHSKHHGHPKGDGDGLYFYTFLWEEWLKGFEHIREVCPDVFLNITSYAHCSPWFLKWCDAVWINNCGDMGYDGKGDDLNQCLCYRDEKYMDFFERRELQFPTAYIYNHEPIYAERNYNPPLPATSHRTVKYSYEQFEEYMYMCMMRGTGFVELYFSPSMFDDRRYKIASDVLTWAEEHFDIIKNSQFFGDNPIDGNVYGYYAFDGERAIMSIRNSSEKPMSYELDNEKRCFVRSAYTIEQYYKIKGDKVFVDEGEKYKIDLSPFESRIYYINLVK